MPNQRAADKRPITVYVRDVNLARFDEAAAKAGMCRSDFIQHALWEAIARQDREAGDSAA